MLARMGIELIESNGCSSLLLRRAWFATDSRPPQPSPCPIHRLLIQLTLGL